MKNKSIVKKWRDHNININDIDFGKDFIIIEEISYPHASNEITEVKAIYKSEIRNFIIKVSRREDSYLERESLILSTINYRLVPHIIIEGLYNDRYYIVMEKVDGERMSELNLTGRLTLEHYKTFGASLGEIHQEDAVLLQAPSRRFHEVLEFDEFVNNVVNPWLKANEPKSKDICFCHGDHHYANVLFGSSNEYTVLDWELAGMGFREFDIAWALVLRPGQEFFKEAVEEFAFLEGYSSKSSYNSDNFKWAKVLISSHFYKIGIENSNHEYVEFLRNQIKKNITSIK